MATTVTLNQKQLSDLYLLAEGAFAPNTGFHDRLTLEAILEWGRLPGGAPWTIPIVLLVDDVPSGSVVELVGEDGRVAGTLEIEEAFPIDKARYAQAVFKTTDLKHPGVAWLRQSGGVALAGPVVAYPDFLAEFAASLALPASPAGTRAAIAGRGWRTVVGFQTRNPIHRAHEFVIKTALELVDGLLLQPLVGETKPGDVPAGVRLRCYRALLDDYFVPQRTLLAALPAWMRYAGPREAIFHALVRKNYGCTHFIVGRDHAGVGNYYGPFEAHDIFGNYKEDELGIRPVFFDRVFYCRRCGSMGTPKTCPHGKEHHLELSGTEVRNMLGRGELPPPEFSRPEVAAILAEHYSSDNHASRAIPARSRPAGPGRRPGDALAETRA